MSRVVLVISSRISLTKASTFWRLASGICKRMGSLFPVTTISSTVSLGERSQRNGSCSCLFSSDSDRGQIKAAFAPKFCRPNTI